MDRATDELIGALEAISGLVFRNRKSIEQIWTSIQRPLRDSHALRMAVYGDLEDYLKKAKVYNPRQINFKRKAELIRIKMEKEKELDKIHGNSRFFGGAEDIDHLI